MSLKALTTQQMKEVSRRWVEAGEAQSILTSLPTLQALLTEIQRVHEGLLENVEHTQADEALLAITEKLAQSDAAHDRLLRGIYRTLSAQADFASTPEEEGELLALRNRLFPRGLEGTQLTYREESGAAHLIESILTEERRATLKDIPAGPGENLLDKVARLLDHGKNIGALEDQREALRETASPQGPSDHAVYQSRLAWIRVVRVLQSNAKLARLDAEAHEKLFGHLLRAEELADKRQASKRAVRAEDANPRKKEVAG